MGGHSGLNIAEGRGNAVVFAARTADAVVSGVPGARLEAIVGGDKRNAIPREASATLTVPAGAAVVWKTWLFTVYWCQEQGSMYPAPRSHWLMGKCLCNECFEFTKVTTCHTTESGCA